MYIVFLEQLLSDCISTNEICSGDGQGVDGQL